ncbi:MAG: threonine/serine dehydratase [Parachlamydia sp.]|nr:threonine/serine dehydratase [Parachlamydia sp.]
MTLSLAMIEKAAETLQPHILKTPIVPSPSLSKLLGVPIYLKLEFLQHTGSFKLRGALFRLSQLPDQEVVTCSAGNHGKAVAYVATKLGKIATIFVPRDVDQAKYQGMLDYGAKVVRSDFPGYDDTEELAKRYAETSQLPFISAFDDSEIMAGNGGTLAMEVADALPEASTFILPVGGGGLSAGFSYYMKERLPNCRIIGCQHCDSPALHLSLKQGSAVTRLPAVQTIAGGVEGGLGASCFHYLKTRIDQVALVTEEEIIHAFRWMLQQHGYLIEPTAAITLAACLSGKIKDLTTPTVIILSGRNVSMETLHRLTANQINS